MVQVGMHEAKTKLSQLVERAEAGEDIVIARNGKQRPGWSQSEAPRRSRRSGGPGVAVCASPTILTNCPMTSLMSLARGEVAAGHARRAVVAG